MNDCRTVCLGLVLSSLLLASVFCGGALRADDNAADAPACDPVAPISGSLVICGGGNMPEPIMQKFVELAGGPEAKIVVIPTASESADTPEPALRLEQWRRRNVAQVSLLHTRDRQVADDPEFVKPLAEATGVWIGGGKQHRLTEAYLGTAVEKLLHSLLARGGVIGGTSSGAAIMSTIMIRQGRTVAEVGQGFGFLPGTVVDQHFIKRNRQPRLLGVLAKNPGLFGLGIDESTAVVVQGRRLSVLGESQVAVCLSPSEERPLKVDLLKSGDEADLVALSRAAIARTLPTVVADREKPYLEQGTLVVVGGGATPPEAVERFIEAAGGADAPLVVVTTAQGGPAPDEAQATAWLKRAGATNVRRVHALNRSEADDPATLKLLAEARGVWFGGGRQWRLVDAYQNTKAERLFHEVLRRGGVIGGSSAGATIQGSYLVRGNPLGNTQIMAEGYERGFAFLPGVAIDQHFSQRNRFADMLELKRAYPHLVGLGIDESTAVIIRGHEMEVVGEHQVAVYDRKSDLSAERPYQVVESGELFDLSQQRPLSMLAGNVDQSSDDEEEEEAPAKQTEEPAMLGN